MSINASQTRETVQLDQRTQGKPSSIRGGTLRLQADNDKPHVLSGTSYRPSAEHSALPGTKDHTALTGTTDNPSTHRVLTLKIQYLKSCSGKMHSMISKFYAFYLMYATLSFFRPVVGSTERASRKRFERETGKKVDQNYASYARWRHINSMKNLWNPAQSRTKKFYGQNDQIGWITNRNNMPGDTKFKEKVAHQHVAKYKSYPVRNEPETGDDLSDTDDDDKSTNTEAPNSNPDWLYLANELCEKWTKHKEIFEKLKTQGVPSDAAFDVNDKNSKYYALNVLQEACLKSLTDSPESKHKFQERETILDKGFFTILNRYMQLVRGWHTKRLTGIMDQLTDIRTYRRVTTKEMKEQVRNTHNLIKALELLRHVRPELESKVDQHGVSYKILNEMQWLFFRANGHLKSFTHHLNNQRDNKNRKSIQVLTQLQKKVKSHHENFHEILRKANPKII